MQIAKIYPDKARVGENVIIYGEGFGNVQGKVFVDNIEAEVFLWSNEKIEIDIPAGVENENAEVKVVVDVYEEISSVIIDFSVHHYCVISDIRKEMPYMSFTTETKITSQSVKKMIDEEADYIDSVLQKIYNVPITNQKAVNVLGTINTYFVVARILRQANMSHGDEDIKESWYYEKAMSRLEQYINMTSILPDVDFYVGGDITMTDAIFRKKDKY